MLYVTCHFGFYRRKGGLRDTNVRLKTSSAELVEESEEDIDLQRNHRVPKNMNLSLGDFLSISDVIQQQQSSKSVKWNISTRFIQ